MTRFSAILDCGTLSFRAVKEIPELHLHAFSAPEIAAIAKYENLDTKYVLQSLWGAGLRTIPGGRAEVLTNRTRRAIRLI